MNKIDGRYLKKLREENGLSLRAFAEKIYASKSSVQRWEKSTVPEDEDLLEKIASVFSTTVEKMREESYSKYSEGSLSPEDLADLKFGIKWLAFPIIGLFSVLAIFTLIVSLL